MNQGTLVAFNLDPDLTNDGLLKIFGEYGEVKEVSLPRHPLLLFHFTPKYYLEVFYPHYLARSSL